MECMDCGLLHRYPTESAAEMNDFYDEGYTEPDITTNLPSEAELQHLISTEFKGSAKDFRYHADMLKAVGLQAGARLLDFGANWGYASWQFQRAGFEVTSFEISKPRARYGEKLGLKIETDLEAIQGPFDAVFSCHVLEHVPNPMETLHGMLNLVKPGGLVIGMTPNGSRSFRELDLRLFNNLWGQSHPVLLTEVFVQGVAGSNAHLITSHDRPEELATWDRQSSEVRDVSLGGITFVIRKQLS
jgi:2-polyprenyl-3-methyl-5-hydroxy-6-metoxy-1,4-benzoquinol methylase